MLTMVFSAQNCSYGLFLACMTAGRQVTGVSSSTDQVEEWSECGLPKTLEMAPSAADDLSAP